MTKSRDELTELDFDDPMDWVYEVRRRISERCGHDIGRLFEYMAERQREAESRGKKFVRLPIVRRSPNVVQST